VDPGAGAPGGVKGVNIPGNPVCERRRDTGCVLRDKNDRSVKRQGGGVRGDPRIIRKGRKGFFGDEIFGGSTADSTGADGLVAGVRGVRELRLKPQLRGKQFLNLIWIFCL